jgi:hypothetical protein
VIQYVILYEGMEGRIVTLSDEVGLGGSEGIGAGKGAVEPRFEALLEGEESKFATSFNPV